MHDHSHHEDLIKGLREEYEDLLENSEQGIYIYFDDNHKICNEKFAKMLGYSSAEEWEKPAEFVETYVAGKSGDDLVSAFQSAMEQGVATSLEITWKKKDGGELPTKVILVPISFDGHLFALHFISSD